MSKACKEEEKDMKNGLELDREEIRGKMEKVLYQLIGPTTDILRKPIGILQRSDAGKDLRDYGETLLLRNEEVMQLTRKLFVYNNNDILEYYHLTRFYNCSLQDHRLPSVSFH